MGFFIVIGCPWLLLAFLDLMKQRRETELNPYETPPVTGSAYLMPDVS
ncbi:hypothetical protein [Methylobacterium soli]|jgi:hypothetical protein|nr:hypothetical protein [Methylobacterium soli]GJE45277.1 hypothetical protein AEGHOMDF_4471 [Methylobacterium soli]